MFAYAAGVGKSIYTVEDRPAILVSLAEEMNIVVPETSVPARYIDVRLEDIEGVTMEEIPGRNKFFIKLALTPKSGDSTFLFNARERFDRLISVAFDDPEDGRELQKFILAKQRGFAELPRMSESQILIDITKGKPSMVNVDLDSSFIPRDDDDPDNLAVTATQAMCALREKSLPTHQSYVGLESGAGILNHQWPPAKENGQINSNPALMSQQNGKIEYPSKPTTQPKPSGCLIVSNAPSYEDESPATSPDHLLPARELETEPSAQIRSPTRQNPPAPAKETQAKSPPPNKTSTNKKPQKAGNPLEGVERKVALVAKMSSTASSSKALKQPPATNRESEILDTVDWEEGLSVLQDSSVDVHPRAKGKMAKSKVAAFQIPAKKDISKKLIPHAKAPPMLARSQAPKGKQRAKNKQPRPASQKPRSTRAAAVAANSKIRGIEGSEAADRDWTASHTISKVAKKDKGIQPGTSSSEVSRSSKRNIASLNEADHDAIISPESTNQVRVGASVNDYVARSEAHPTTNSRALGAGGEELQPPDGSHIVSSVAQGSKVTQVLNSDRIPDAQDRKNTQHQVGEAKSAKQDTTAKVEEKYIDRLEIDKGLGTVETLTATQAMMESIDAAGTKPKFKAHPSELYRDASLTDLRVENAVHDHNNQRNTKLHNYDSVEPRECNSATVFESKSPIQEIRRDCTERNVGEVGIQNNYFEEAMAFADHRNDTDEQRFSQSRGHDAIALPLNSDQNFVSLHASPTQVEVHGPSNTIQPDRNPLEYHTKLQDNASQKINQAFSIHDDAPNNNTSNLPFVPKSVVPTVKPFVGDTLQRALSAFEDVDHSRDLTLRVEEHAQKGTNSNIEDQIRSSVPQEAQTDNRKLIHLKKGSVLIMKGENSPDNKIKQEESALHPKNLAVVDLLNASHRKPQAGGESKTAKEPLAKFLRTPSSKAKGLSQNNAIHITSSREVTSSDSSENASPEKSYVNTSVNDRVDIRLHQRAGRGTPTRKRQPPDDRHGQQRVSTELDYATKAENAVPLVQDHANNTRQQTAPDQPIISGAIQEPKKRRLPRYIETLDGQTDKRILIGTQATMMAAEQRDSHKGTNSGQGLAGADELIASKPKPRVDTAAGLRDARTREARHSNGSIKTPGDPDRKSTLIGFDAKGPRNQGLSSAPKRSFVDSLADPRFDRPKAEAMRAKRKHQSGEADAKSDQALEPPEKRARVLVPETVLPVKEPSDRRISSSMAFPQRNSSQGTRVTEDGSPMPNPLSSLHAAMDGGVTHALRSTSIPEVDTPVHDATTSIQGVTDIEVSEHRLSTEKSEVDHNIPLPGTKYLPKLSWPVVTVSSHKKVDNGKVQTDQKQRTWTQPVKQRKSVVKGNPWMYSSSSKAQPSSPSAPSQMLATMEVFQQQSGGEFTNVQTEKVVRAQPPTNPFVGIGHERPTSFMERLRKLDKETSQPHRKPIASNNVPTHRVSYRSTVKLDPEKTLVENHFPDQENRFRRHPANSSSHSSSSRTTNVFEPSEGSETDTEADTTRKWREALRPHQKDTFATLAKINHVSHDVVCSFMVFRS